MISIPFPGNKRRCYKRIKETFRKGGYTKVMEPFGGSCVLSVNLYNDGLVEKAVVNDFDHLFDLYPEYLDKKDWVVNKMHERGVFRSVGVKGNMKRFTNAEETEWKPIENHPLPMEDKKYLEGLMLEVGREWWKLMSYGSVFNHAGVPNNEPIRLKDWRYFKGRTSTKWQREYYEVAKNLERDSCDWREFLNKHEREMDDKTLLLVDPPYFGTYNAAYHDRKISEADTIDLITRLNAIGVDYVFFNSDLEWVENALRSTGVEDYEVMLVGVRNQSMNRNRQDVMAYVRHTK